MRKKRHKFIKQVAEIARCPLVDIKQSFASFGFQCEGASVVWLCDSEGNLLQAYGSDVSEMTADRYPEAPMNWRPVTQICQAAEGLMPSRIYGSGQNEPFSFPNGCDDKIEVQFDPPRVHRAAPYKTSDVVKVGEYLLAHTRPLGGAH